ncbi:hypothetical protein AAHB53_04575 [Niallia circulans]
MQSMEERDNKWRKNKKRQQTEASNVEFGQEFGDVNASKFYDTGALTKDKTKRATRKNKNFPSVNFFTDGNKKLSISLKRALNS